MKLLKLFIVALIVIGSTINKVEAQRNYAQEADQAFELKQYFEAITLYKKAYTKIKKNKAEKARIITRTADCYRLLMDTKQAEAWYKKVIKLKDVDPVNFLYYADALKSNEKYPDAVIQYDAYKALVPADVRGSNGSESCVLAQKWKDNPTRYEVENFKIINTKDLDMQCNYADKKFKTLYFASSREGSAGNEIDATTGLGYTDIFSTTQDKKGTWSTPIPLPEPINTKGNEGTPCLNAKMNEMYFTRCGVEKKQIVLCKIYRSKKKGATAWDEPELIPLVPDSFACGHPSLSDDELSLYFATDMPGGQGGFDIWVAKRTKKSKPFDAPTNLGPSINTSGDELYPFLRDDKTLYFASDGLIGMGGLDNFKVVKTNGKWGTPQNLMFPMNSSADDYAVIFQDKNEKGFFSSNRKGGKGMDDIWSFYMPPLIFTLQGVVKDDTTKLAIPGALVKLKGSDGTSIQATTDITGLYKFDKTQIKIETSYTLSVSKEGYFGANGKETTVGLQKSKDLVHDFNLIPIPKKPIVLPDILYAFNSAVLQEQYKDSLNGLFQTLTDNPTITIELASHTDLRGSIEYNDTLSFKRAKSVVDYLISKGVAADRMTPKGYGERVPRTLEKDKIVVYEKKKYMFPKGTVFTESYINSLKTEPEKEAAHQLNRRTEFQILKSNYVPKTVVDTSAQNIEIKIVTDVKADSLEQDSLKRENERIQKEEELKKKQDELNKLNNQQNNNKSGTKPTNNKVGTKPTTKPTTKPK